MQVQNRFDLHQYLDAVWRGKWLIVVTTVAALAVAFALVSVQPDTSDQPTIYEARQTISSRNGQTTPSLPNLSTPGLSGLSSLAALGSGATGTSSVQTQILVMTSRNVLERAVTKIWTTNAPAGGAGSQPSEAFMSAQVETLRVAIRVRPVAQTNLLEVTAQAPSAELAQQRLDAVVQAYADYLKEERTRAIQEALDEVQSQLAKIGDVVTLGPQELNTLLPVARQVQSLADRLDKDVAKLVQFGASDPMALGWEDLAVRSQRMTLQATALQNEASQVQAVRQRLEETQTQQHVRRAKQSTTDIIAAVDSALTDMNALIAAEPAITFPVTQVQQQLTALRSDLKGMETQVRSLPDRLTPGSATLLLRTQQNRAQTGAYSIDALALRVQAVLVTPDLSLTPLATGRLRGIDTQLRSVADELRSLSRSLDELADGMPPTPLITSIVNAEQALALAAQSTLAAQRDLDSFLALATDEVTEEDWTRLGTGIAQSKTLVDGAISRLGTATAAAADPATAADLINVTVRVQTVQAALQKTATAVSALQTALLDGGSANSGDFALVASRLEETTGSLLTPAAASLTRLAQGQLDDAQVSATLSDIESKLQIGAVALAQVSAGLTAVPRPDVDFLSLSQIVVIREEIDQSAKAIGEIATQLAQVGGNSGPGYQELLSLQRQLELERLGPQDTGITVVDSSVTAQASGSSSILSLGKSLALPLAALAGLTLGVAASLLRRSVDNSIYRPEQVQGALGIAPLGIIPTGIAHGNPHPPLITDEKPPHFPEAVRSLATDIKVRWASERSSLLITSTGPREGKTMLAVNLAMALAEHGDRVLLIDGNLRKPEINVVLDLPADRGLIKALSTGRDPAEFIQRVKGMDVLTAGGESANPVEVVASQKWTAFLQWAERQYDFVLIDGAPFLGFAETKVLAKQVEAALLVVRTKAASLDTFKESYGTLTDFYCSNVGVVINFAQARDARHLNHETYRVKSKRSKGEDKAGTDERKNEA